MRSFRFAFALLLLTTVCAPVPQQPVVAPARINPNQGTNDRFVRQMAERIAGHENDPAAEVFKNIQLPWMKKVPAGRLLRIMNEGYSKALGVACTHCHVEADFASDDKRTKRAAREMAEMHFAINQQLAKMKNFDDAPNQRFVNCSTCHRGSTDPRAADK